MLQRARVEPAIKCETQVLLALNFHGPNCAEDLTSSISDMSGRQLVRSGVHRAIQNLLNRDLIKEYGRIPTRGQSKIVYQITERGISECMETVRHLVKLTDAHLIYKE